MLQTGVIILLVVIPVILVFAIEYACEQPWKGWHRRSRHHNRRHRSSDREPASELPQWPASRDPRPTRSNSRSNHQVFPHPDNFELAAVRGGRSAVGRNTGKKIRELKPMPMSMPMPREHRERAKDHKKRERAESVASTVSEVNEASDVSGGSEDSGVSASRVSEDSNVSTIEGMDSRSVSPLSRMRDPSEFEFEFEEVSLNVSPRRGEGERGVSFAEWV